MDSMNHLRPEREVQRAQASRDELAERIARAVRDNGTAEPMDRRRISSAAPTGSRGRVNCQALTVVFAGRSSRSMSRWVVRNRLRGEDGRIVDVMCSVLLKTEFGDKQPPAPRQRWSGKQDHA